MSVEQIDRNDQCVRIADAMSVEQINRNDQCVRIADAMSVEQLIAMTNAPA
jgi:hypothetical protein